ncbi:hypothetical protein GMDG_00407 [Pseudogymnoascus destructans 20631-21]|uniref:Uncharacterized protein n=1 Tax=Pseudogymnoascus destructans (strain ATCC MYA-4855 / 20631-21) TaxID=658429 RepID=L8G4N3_PSED2|nr:hypothetical protein, variant [Pseudogymnoascus destructans 20631-21]ELR07785.1 hypothetical protein GMDG_00407 [Pseudogymnoascus destructans 20631-21]
MLTAKTYHLRGVLLSPRTRTRGSGSSATYARQFQSVSMSAAQWRAAYLDPLPPVDITGLSVLADIPCEPPVTRVPRGRPGFGGTKLVALKGDELLETTEDSSRLGPWLLLSPTP